MTTDTKEVLADDDWRWIEDEARRTMRHHSSQCCNQTMTRADNPDSHFVWAALAWAEKQQQSELASLRKEVEGLRAENTTLRTVVAKAPGTPCVYCGLEDMSRCAAGFPGCAKADDIICGEDEMFRRVAEERNRLRAMVPNNGDAP